MRKVLIILIFFYFSIYFGQQISPYFRIIAPKFICPSRNDIDIPPPSQITIRMQTTSGQLLKYRVQIYFQILGSYKSQQHTLKIWRSIRTLEKKIKNQTDIITMKNQINIINEELTSGVLYVFNIIGIDENGLESDAKNYTVTFNDGKTSTSNDGFTQSDERSLLLIGSEVMYSDTEYIVEALVIFCFPTSYYYFEWDIINLNDVNKDFLKIKGKLLRIPSDTLKGGNNYQIIVNVHSLNDSSIISSTGLKMKILKKAFSASLVPTKLLTGTNGITTFKLTIQDHENTGTKPQINWTCKNIINENINCDIIPNANALQFSIMFPTQGEYKIIASIKLNEYSKILASVVNVQSEVLVSLNFDLPPKQPFNNDATFSYNVDINNLVPDCFAEWKVMNEENFQYFDSLILPNGLGNISIKDVERNFLSELIDYDNNTVSENILLTIPSAFDDIVEWKGLMGDSSYKFRLEITCPKPYDENYRNISENIFSYAEMIINTNKPPDGLKLDISPLTGVSMKTIFKFSTGIAKDIESDYPLKYIFFYTFAEIVIKVGEFIENMVATSELPYSSNLISTYYIVCDVRNACSKIFGPNITTELNSNFTDSELNFKMQLFKNAMFRMEYNYAFSVAFACLSTLKNTLDQSNYDAILLEIMNTIKFSIEAINSAKSTENYLDKNNIFQFIELLKSLCDYFNICNEKLVEYMLDVLNLIINYEDYEESYEQTTLKRKRKSILANNKMKFKCKQNFIVGEKFVKIALSLSEQLLNSKNNTIVANEQQKLLRKVRQYMMQLCIDIDGGSRRYIDSKIVQIDVQTITAQQLKTGQFVLKSNSNNNLLKIQLNNVKEINEEINEYCIARATYITDHLNNDNVKIYDALIIERGLTRIPPTIISINKYNDYQYPLMYIFNKENLNNHDYVCALWKEQKWSTEYCTNFKSNIKILKCICKSFGVLKLLKTISLEANETFETQLNENSSQTIAKLFESSTLSMDIYLENVTIIDDETHVSDLYSTIIQITDLNINTEESDNSIISLTELNSIEVSGIESNSTISVTEFNTITDLALLLPTIPYSNTTNILNLPEIGSNRTNNTKEIREKQSINYTTVEYSLLGLFLLIALLTIVATVIYHRRKRAAQFLQHFEIMAIEPRLEAANVKYGKFFDEHIMRGSEIN